jgi:hypothetical protein
MPKAVASDPAVSQRKLAAISRNRTKGAAHQDGRIGFKLRNECFPMRFIISAIKSPRFKRKIISLISHKVSNVSC